MDRTGPIDARSWRTSAEGTRLSVPTTEKTVLEMADLGTCDASFSSEFSQAAAYIECADERTLQGGMELSHSS